MRVGARHHDGHTEQHSAIPADITQRPTAPRRHKKQRPVGDVHNGPMSPSPLAGRLVKQSCRGEREVWATKQPIIARLRRTFSRVRIIISFLIA